MTSFKKILFSILVLALLALAYVAGATNGAPSARLVEELRKLAKHALAGWEKTAADSPSAASVNRLTNFPGKKEISCPEQDPKTAVLLLLGQSNAGNHAGQRFSSAFGGNIVNFFDSKCYIAESPLLGSTGSWGESWTLLGNNLVGNRKFDKVILVPAAVSGSTASRWQSGSDVNAMLMTIITNLKAHYRITHILWHQGESDFAIGTREDEYRRMFTSMLKDIRGKGIAAPIFVSVATKCADGPIWNAGNPTARAQRSLPDSKQSVFAGVDTDALLGDTDRFDGCHFGSTGQQKFARAWYEIIDRAGKPYPSQ